MAMAEVRKEGQQWVLARARWEAEPQMTFSDVAVLVGVSKQAVSKHAKRCGWHKHLDMPTLVAKAHAKADEQTVRTIEQDAGGSQAEARQVVAPSMFFAGLSRPALPADASHEQARQITTDAAVDARAELLTRHRREWGAVRNLAYDSIKSKDLDKARTAKTAAEAVKTIQDGERKAWGLDSGDEGPVKVTVVRGGE
ncbi:hypothetical protein [Cupriavidus sp. D39]|uniref:hypothetical protein n=1 Tax=Cupriavidus sp. D39 TaxID=2997877 RepID=UPI00226D4229|nr:hypothetical protein [Cupriavidus sp. D39]MCY0856872.1 hypothetical protein [Cupriavidus sp. D39]